MKKNIKKQQNQKNKKNKNKNKQQTNKKQAKKKNKQKTITTYPPPHLFVKGYIHVLRKPVVLKHYT